MEHILLFSLGMLTQTPASQTTACSETKWPSPLKQMEHNMAQKNVLLFVMLLIFLLRSSETLHQYKIYTIDITLNLTTRKRNWAVLKVPYVSGNFNSRWLEYFMSRKSFSQLIYCPPNQSSGRIEGTPVLQQPKHLFCHCREWLSY